MHGAVYSVTRFYTNTVIMLGAIEYIYLMYFVLMQNSFTLRPPPPLLYVCEVVPHETVYQRKWLEIMFLLLCCDIFTVGYLWSTIFQQFSTQYLEQKNGTTFSNCEKR